MEDTSTILTMQNINKTFPGVKALDNVSFTCYKGEVHALVGENGAGKSTLMKILCGAYQPDSGVVILDGQEVQIRNTRHAQEVGISIIYQEFNLIPYRDIAQNIFLGREPLTPLKAIDYSKMYADAAKIMEMIGEHLDLREWVMNLAVAEQQMVEIAKALAVKAKIVVMDEPSSALSEEETTRLFKIIQSLKEQGITVIYITHRIKEVFEIADRVTVLKDGTVVTTENIENLDESSLVRLMIGRILDDLYPEKGVVVNEKILSVQGLTREGTFKDICFDLYKGEVLGFAGLIGSGRTEIMQAVFGAKPFQEGTIELKGQPIRIKSPSDAAQLGIGMIPEDRRNDGLILILPVRSNIVLPVLDRIKRGIFTNRKKEKTVSNELISSLSIKTPSCESKVENLSGGNQQKVVLSKWLAAKPQVIIFDEPTRGIDVGAKAEIHRIMRELAKNGTGVIMISSELPEVLGMSDRVVVMYSGRITATFDWEEATEEKVMAAATGVWRESTTLSPASPAITG